MPATFEPSPDRQCPMCAGEGYQLKIEQLNASAMVCQCVPSCARCGDTGMVEHVTETGVRYGRCRCQMLPDRIRLFNAAQLPSRHSSNSFRNFDHHSNSASQALVLCTKWLHAFTTGKEHRGLVLTGQVGRGKTHLMIAIARSLIFEHGRSVRFIEFSRLLSQLREGYGKGISDSPTLNHLCSVPLLIIDELGKGRLTDWELSIIDEVVSRRYNANLPILGTTNYKWGPPTGAAAPNIAAREFDEQTLGDRVGGRVFSRLQESALYFECKGPDYRAMKPQNLSHI
ncbi:MAG: ATP-binding protein [Myxococcota bacterium]